MLQRLLQNLMCATAIPLFAMADEGEPMDIIELEENLEDAEKPAELPPGKYKGEVQNVQSAKSGAGNDYYAVQFRIPPEEIPADIREQYEDGALLFWNRTIKPRSGADRRAIYNLKKFVTALGLNTNVTTIDPNEWMGQEATLIVVSGTYQGERRAEIRAVESAEAAPARRPERGASVPKAGKSKAPAGRARK